MSWHVAVNDSLLQAPSGVANLTAWLLSEQLMISQAYRASRYSFGSSPVAEKYVALYWCWTLV